MTEQQVSQLAKALIEAKEKVKTASAVLKVAGKHAKFLEEEALPAAMQELGYKKLTLDNGQTITISLKVYAKIPDALKSKAMGWLVSNGFEGIIKNEIKVDYGTKEFKEAEKLINHLRREGANYTEKEFVHPQTLTAFLREQISKKKPIPMDLFGARSVFAATVKETK